nr:MAG TPA: hypothetical protein [Caudoviricetes sp.]
MSKIFKTIYYKYNKYRLKCLLKKIAKLITIYRRLLYLEWR